MMYQRGDKFLIEGLETEVRHVNQGMAWVVPTEGDWTHVVIDRLDEYGFSRKGIKAIPITNQTCMAV